MQAAEQKRTGTGILHRCRAAVEWRVRYLIRRNGVFQRFFFSRFKRKNPNAPVKLNLGCNIVYMDGWINIDVDWRVRADVYADIRKLTVIFPGESVDAILMSHVISYFSLEAAQRFFRLAYSLLRQGGTVIFEFPDIRKIAVSLTETRQIDDGEAYQRYLELLRPIFASVPETISGGRKYDTYVFAWSAMHMEKALRAAGFREIRVLPPEYHGRQILRDTRIEAVK